MTTLRISLFLPWLSVFLHPHKSLDHYLRDTLRSFITTG